MRLERSRAGCSHEKLARLKILIIILVLLAMSYKMVFLSFAYNWSRILHFEK